MIVRYRYIPLLLIVALSFGGFARAQEKTKDKDLPNFSMVNASLYRGGQPTAAGVKKLKQDHKVKTIIFLRGKGERADKEKEWADAVGVKFINIPLHNWFRPKHSQIKTALSDIDNTENQPVFVHCKRGSDRTGMVIAVYRMENDGYTAKQANEEAKKFGIGWWQFWMKDYINDYYRDFIVKK